MDNPPSSNVGGPRLELLEARPHTFEAPTKRIHDGQDLSSFLTSLAYHDIVTFLFQLNRSMFPSFKDGAPETIESWDLSSPITLKPPTQRLQQMINALDAMIEEAPPDTGPRRFGNVSFRKWYDLVESRMSALLEEAIDPDVLGWPTSPKSEQSAETELRAYLFGSFGSSQRLDYGTGHELSFLAFLGCLWKLGTFPQSSPGVEERSIVIGVIEPYVSSCPDMISTSKTPLIHYQIPSTNSTTDLDLQSGASRIPRSVGIR
jgi:serine/threonine-protein phosphatase 2A activator